MHIQKHLTLVLGRSADTVLCQQGSQRVTVLVLQQWCRGVKRHLILSVLLLLVCSACHGMQAFSLAVSTSWPLRGPLFAQPVWAGTQFPLRLDPRTISQVCTVKRMPGS